MVQAMARKAGPRLGTWPWVGGLSPDSNFAICCAAMSSYDDIGSAARAAGFDDSVVKVRSGIPRVPLDWSSG